MAFQPIFNDIDLTIKSASVNERISVECKTEIPSENVSKVLNVWARTIITHSECVEDGVLYQGKTTFFVCYIDAEGKTCKTECGVECKGKIATPKGQTLRCVAFGRVEKTEADVSGTRLQVTAKVLVVAELVCIKKINALTSGEELITDGKEVTVYHGYGLRETIFPIEEQFTLDYKVQEVLSQRAETVITAVQCGVGCIIVDGEVYLSAILLQNGDKNDIIRENKTLPFRAEIDCEDAMPNMTAIAFVKEKSFKTDITVEEDGDKSEVNASISLLLQGECYYAETVNVVTDAFSLTETLNVERQTYLYSRPLELRSSGFVVEGGCGIDELPVGATLLACIGESAEIVSVEGLDKEEIDAITVNGVLSTTVFLKDAEGKVFTRHAETPFTEKVEVNLTGSLECDLKICAQKCKAKMVSATQLEISSTVCVTVYPWEKNQVSVVEKITSTGVKELAQSAISVYIPCEGEEMWSLAKRLNVCPNDLITVNPDLTFPLSGEERIVIYRQK